MYTKVKDAPGFVRGENSAILSTDVASLTSYKKRSDQLNEMRAAVHDINNMKIELNEIKSMLQTIIGKIQNG